MKKYNFQNFKVIGLSKMFKIYKLNLGQNQLDQVRDLVLRKKNNIKGRLNLCKGKWKLWLLNMKL